MKKGSLQQNLLQKQKPYLSNNPFFKLHSVSNNYRTQFQMQDPKMKLLLQLQGQCKITNLKFIRLHYLKAFFLLIPVIASIVGLWFLKHYKSFRVMIMYVIQEEATNASDVWIIGNQGEYEEIQKVQKIGNKLTFQFKKLRYQVKQNQAYPLGLKYWQKYNVFFNSQYAKKGLDTEQVALLQKEYGPNIHQVQIPTYLWYMFDIMTKPFFLIQYMICIMFILEQITIFAIILFGSTLVTTSINYVLLYFSFLKIKQIAESKVKINVIRNGLREQIWSDQLYPGDVMEVIKNLVLPCDCILVSGEAYVNEASLTGQSVPVGKYKVQAQHQIFQNNRWLYEGSKILDCRHDPKALVINTGYRSRRGAIIRKISNKVHVDPQMFKTAIYFLLQTLFVGIIVYLVTLPILLKANLIPAFRVYRFLDFIGFSFPPTFPIYFNLAYSFSLYRLRKKGIFGTEPHKTIESAFLKTLCFDKTGTLTQNQLQVQKVYAFKDNSFNSFETNQFKNRLSDQLVDKIYEIFCTCHSVKIIDGQQMGDQVDLRMFQATKQNIQVPAGQDIKFRVTGHKNLDILKINQFESKYQHMSVLVFNPQIRQYDLFIKGAPEKIHNFSTTKYTYFDNLLKNVSLNGYRSIGLAYRTLSQEEAQKLIKSEIPRDIFNESHKNQFKMIGLVTFQNKLKQDTKETIRKVQQSKIETKIITGDNLYIAIQTANRAGILKKKLNEKVIVLQGKNQKTQNQVENLIQERKFRAKMLSFSLFLKDGQSQRVLQKQQEIILTESDSYLNTHYPIAVDNEFLLLEPPPRLSHKIKIFARITPQNKAMIIKRLKQELNQEYDQKSQIYKLAVNRPKIGMVGDGANDLMALKQADVGFGISETDASYGSCFSIKQLLNIQQSIRESKCTASIIVECLRYYGSISFLKITCSILMMTETTYFSATQLTYFNFASTVIIPIFITMGSPSQLITPLKPMVNMLSVKNHLIYWGNIIIPSLSIICGFLYFRSRDDYINNPVQRLTLTGFFTLCQNTTVVFLLVQIHFALNAFFCYNNGPRFKQPIYKNYILFILILLNFTADLFYFFKTESLKGFLGLVPIPKDSAGILVAITLGFCVISLLYNYWVQTRRYEQKAFIQEYPNENIQLFINNSKIDNSSLQIQSTQAFQMFPNKQKTIRSMAEVQFK